VTLVGAGNLPSLAEAALRGEAVSDADIEAEIAPCFLNGHARTDTVVLACTHFPLLLGRLERLAPWPVAWIDPAPAIARRTSDLIGPPLTRESAPRPRMLFTSGDSALPEQVLAPFFGSRIAA
jgi:glutamate racemase